MDKAHSDREETYEAANTLTGRPRISKITKDGKVSFQVDGGRGDLPEEEAQAEADQIESRRQEKRMSGYVDSEENPKTSEPIREEDNGVGRPG